MAEVQGQEAQEVRAAIERVEKRKDRKFKLLGIVLAAAIVLIAIAVLILLLPPPPEENPCMNQALDPGEEGIDCGGTCAKECPKPPEPEPEYVDSAHVLPSSLSDIAVNSAGGRIYALDVMRHRVMLYDSEFQHIKNFGEQRTKLPDGGWDYQSGGTTNNKLLFPGSISLAQGKVFVLDRENRIQVLSADLVFEKSLKLPEEAIEKLPKLVDTPNTDGGMISMAVAANGNIYIADEVGNSVAALSPSLELIGSVGFGSSQGKVSMPRQVAVDSEGNVFVADAGNGRVQVFGPSLEFARSIEEKLLIPSGIAVSSAGKVFVSDLGDSKIKVFDSQGKFLEEAGGLGKGDGRFYNPAVIKQGSQGKLYIVEEGNNRVQVLGENLQFVKIVEGLERTFLASLAPFYPAISPNGDIAVSDPINSKVIVLGQDFKLKKIIGSKGFGNNEFNAPKGLAFDPEGNLFVSDSGNRRVQVFSQEYNYLRSITHDELIWPLAVTVDEQGNTYVVDDKYKKALIFDKQGSFKGQIGPEKGITLPLGILAQGGKIYITDDKEKTIEVFDYALKKLTTVSDIDTKAQAHVEFNESLALDSKGRLLLCDNRNRSVLAYDFSKGIFEKFGDFGSSILELSILEVAADAKNIVVADMEYHRVKVFNQDGQEIAEIDVVDLA